MKKLVLPHTATREVGRVTAGLPSLSEGKRLTLDIAGYKREWNNASIAESEAKARNAAMADESRPKNLLEAQLGKPMTGHEFRRKVLKINPTVIFRERHDLKRYAIYIPNREKVVDEWAREFYMGAIEMGLMPEAEVIPSKKVRRIDPSTGGFYEEEVIDEQNMHLMRRGWRTVLVRLIQNGAISEEQAEKAFGRPSFENKQWAQLLGHRQ